MAELRSQAPSKQCVKDAVRTIADAAAAATKVIAAAAAEAAKVVNVKSTTDHDLLIELKTRMDSLKDDIRDLKDGTTVKIADHESRIFSLESTKGKQTVLITIGTSVIVVILTLLLYHLTGIKL
jgi:hypothetical protein